MPCRQQAVLHLLLSAPFCVRVKLVSSTYTYEAQLLGSFAVGSMSTNVIPGSSCVLCKLSARQQLSFQPFRSAPQQLTTSAPSKHTPHHQHRHPEQTSRCRHFGHKCAAAASDPVVANSSSKITTTTWKWEGYNIRIQQCGSTGPPLVCVHGFGGNCAHWRKNLPVLGDEARVFAIDLLGYGYSDKPNPRQYETNELYNFETWGRQLSAFIEEVVGEPAFLICNSVGGIAGLQAAVQSPKLVLGVQLQNVSLRMLHKKRQSAIQRPFVKALQTVLRTTPLGKLFFCQIATKKGVKNVLSQAYADATQVTDELVDCILQPGLQEGAVDVFLDFISYSGGPLAEDLLEVIQQPVSILWGAEDPWEKVEWGRKLQHYPTVEEFVAFPGVGHCPMDEAPDLINPAIMKFVKRHVGNAAHA